MTSCEFGDISGCGLLRMLKGQGQNVGDRVYQLLSFEEGDLSTKEGFQKK
jgi:hypothetical protein